MARGRVQLLRVEPGEASQAVAAVDELQRLASLDPDWSWSRACVIAREWRSLHAVRSLCEARGLPVEMANERPPPLWRLREMRELVEALRGRGSELVTAAELKTLVAARPDTRWRRLLRDGLDLLDADLAGKGAPGPDLVEWLAEWSRDARGVQRGLLLLTAHRAKGLEFDDVAILDGDWARASRGEDADAPRRLLYVAMTRARRSLAILSRGEDAHPLLPPEMRAQLLERRVASRPEAHPDCGRRHQLTEPAHVDLSYAGRLADGHPAHRAIARLAVGDELRMHEAEGRWPLRDGEGVVMGRMAKAYQSPPGARLVRVTIAAVIPWRKQDNGEVFHAAIRRDTWEVVLPEVEFETSPLPLS